MQEDVHFVQDWHLVSLKIFVSLSIIGSQLLSQHSYARTPQGHRWFPTYFGTTSCFLQWQTRCFGVTHKESTNRIASLSCCSPAMVLGDSIGITCFCFYLPSCCFQIMKIRIGFSRSVRHLRSYFVSAHLHIVTIAE